MPFSIVVCGFPWHVDASSYFELAYVLGGGIWVRGAGAVGWHVTVVTVCMRTVPRHS